MQVTIDKGTLLSVAYALEFMIERREEDVSYFSGDEDADTVESLQEDIDESNKALAVIEEILKKEGI